MDVKCLQHIFGTRFVYYFICEINTDFVSTIENCFGKLFNDCVLDGS